MTISELKSHLTDIDSVNFKLPNGKSVPSHFHITEVGLITKHFIDCGGKVRQERSANIQIWVAADLLHKLKPNGFLNILDISKKILGDDNLDIEIEYQTDTVGKYGLDFKNGDFVLTSKQTDCLAKENCGIPSPKKIMNALKLEVVGSNCCSPGGGCC